MSSLSNISQDKTLSDIVVAENNSEYNIPVVLDLPDEAKGLG